MSTFTQRSFAGGEVAPALRARADMVKYATGLTTCKNFYIKKAGGVASRHGTRYVGETERPSTGRVVLVPFISDTVDSIYILEFSGTTMKVIYDGAYVTETALDIDSITQADPGVLETDGNHGYSDDDTVLLSITSSMIELHNRYVKVNNENSGETFELVDLVLPFPGNDIDTSGYTAYVDGTGTCAKLVEIDSGLLIPNYLTYAQLSEELIFCSEFGAPRVVTRVSHAEWTIAAKTFGSALSVPGGLDLGDQEDDLSRDTTQGGAQWIYVVTGIEDTGDESLQSSVGDRKSVKLASASLQSICVTQDVAIGATFVINGIYHVDDAFIKDWGAQLVFTEITAPPISHTDKIFVIRGEDIEGNLITEEVVGPDKDQSVMSLNHYATIDEIRLLGTGTDPMRVAVGVASTEIHPIKVECTYSSAPDRVRVYRSIQGGVFGLTAEAPNLNTDNKQFIEDYGGIPDYSTSPPVEDADPSSIGPGAITYFQQRLVFGSGDLNADRSRITMSRVGLYDNFFVNNPVMGSSAIDFILAGDLTGEIRHFADLGRLIVFTTTGEWIVEGGADGVITPFQLNARRFSNYGSGDIAPIIIGSNAIFLQERSSVVRDLSVLIESDGYRGNDLTVFSTHLFEGYMIDDWAYQQIPDSVVWAVRSDGILLGMTYLPEHQIFGWHRHVFTGTDAECVGVCSVPSVSGSSDETYVVIYRTIDGREVATIERMFGRFDDIITDTINVDAAMMYDGTNTAATTMTITTGTTYVAGETLTVTASVANWTAADVGNGVQFIDDDGNIIRFIIVGYTSTTIVTGTADTDIPAGLQDTATATWADMVDQLAGLHHLEGEEVSVLADGYILSSPYNSAYATLSVTDGIVTLAAPYAIIKIGLPIVCDLETLDIDPAQVPFIDHYKNVSKVTMSLERSSKCYVGASDPGGVLLTGLHLLDMSSTAGNSDPTDGYISLHTANEHVNIRSEWNSNGRVFVRHVDPIPLEILAIAPAVAVKERGTNRRRDRR